MNYPMDFLPYEIKKNFSTILFTMWVVSLLVVASTIRHFETVVFLIINIISFYTLIVDYGLRIVL